MAQERSKHFIPLPPLPEFYIKTTQGNIAPASSSSSSSSHDKTSTVTPTGVKKVTVEVEANAKAKRDALPTGGPSLPLAKPQATDVTIHDAPSLQPIKLPLHPPPPLPPGLSKDDPNNMSYRYSHHYRHVYEPNFDSKPTKSQQPAAARIITIPPPPPGFPGFQQAKTTPAEPTKLTIYHICRICMRPRSDKYHREHPIPVNGVPPPPGICRRCRITSVEDKNEYMKTVQVEESDKVKFGLSAFVPKRNLATRDEAVKTIQKQYERGYAEKLVMQCSSESESDDDSEHVVYRFVKKTKRPVSGDPPVRRAAVSVENLAAMNLMNDLRSPRGETKNATLKVHVDTEAEAEPIQQTTGATRQNARVYKLDKADAPTTASSSKSTTSVPTTPNYSKDDRKTNAKASVSVNTSVASSHSKVKATAQAATSAANSYTESEIRNFARDEVERYRQAERMMHAHPSAYAHGRLVPIVPEVPVERRIEVVADKVEPKPWETPNFSRPLSGKVSTASRAKHTSTASTDGTDYLRKSPGEEPSHWCRVVEKAASATRSAREEASVSRTGRSDNGRQRSERDVEVFVERDRRPEYQAPQGLPESDPPVSVKLKEVIGIVRDEPAGSRRAPARSGRPQRPDVIEVIEEIELPPAPPVSHRVKVLREERGGDDPRGTRKAEPASTSRETSFRADKSYWEDEGFARTASDQSSTRAQLYAETNTSSKAPSLRAEQGSTSSELRLETEKVALPSPKHFIPKMSAHGRSSDDSWYASRVRSVQKAKPTREQAKLSTRQREDDEKTVWPKDDAPVRPAASERASLREDWDWEYRVRTVQTADGQSGRESNHSGPARSYTDTERLIRHRRPSEPTTHQHEREATAQPSSAKSDHIPARATSARATSAAPPSPTISTLSKFKTQPSPPPDRGRGPYMRTSDESTHVRFASKVEFSPTPPGGDEFLPERFTIKQSKPASAQSSKAGGRKSALRNQIDGGASEPTGSAEEIIREYEAGRARSGRDAKGTEYVPVSSKGASSIASRSRGSEIPSSKPQSNRSYASQRSASLCDDHTGFSLTASRERERESAFDEDERQSSHSLRGRSEISNRRSSPSNTGTGTATNTETATQLSRSRRLARALSESPSRERLRLDSLRAEREEVQSGRGGREVDVGVEGEISDGKGPYMEEVRTESMDAWYGSGHGGVEGRAEGRGRGRW